MQVWKDVVHSRESFTNLINATWNLTKHYAYDDFDDYAWFESDRYVYKVKDIYLTGNEFLVTVYDAKSTEKLSEIKCICWDLVYEVIKFTEKHKYKTFDKLKDVIENVSLYDLPKHYYKGKVI